MIKNLLKSSSILFLFAIVFNSCQKDVEGNTVVNNYLKPPLVGAGNPRTIQLPVSYDTLRGTVTSYNGPIYGYLWSLISGPNVPVIESPSSPSTRISNMIAGIYKFQFAAIDSAGLTGVATTSITVKPNPVVTLTLQPTNNANESVLVLFGSSSGANSNATEMAAEAWTNGGSPFLLRSLFKFDLSSIPAQATILSAKLTLYSNPFPLNGNLVDANSGTANAMYLQRVSSTWDPASVTWNTQPSIDAASQVLLPQTNLAMLDLVDIDVKDMVSAMKSTGNYGFEIRLQNEVAYNGRNFCSSRNTDASKHPKLIITYQ